MKVSNISNLLEQIASGLEPIAASSVVNELRAFGEALGPFGNDSTTEFAKFMAACDEYRRTGIVATSGKKGPAKAKKEPSPEQTTQFVERIRSMLGSADRGELPPDQIDAFADELNVLSKPEIDAILARLELTKASKKPDAVKKIRQMLTNQAEIGSRMRATEAR